MKSFLFIAAVLCAPAAFPSTLYKYTITIDPGALTPYLTQWSNPSPISFVSDRLFTYWGLSSSAPCVMNLQNSPGITFHSGQPDSANWCQRSALGFDFAYNQFPSNIFINTDMWANTVTPALGTFTRRLARIYNASGQSFAGDGTATVTLSMYNPVPEPATGVVAAAALCVAAMLRRRHAAPCA